MTGNDTHAIIHIGGGGYIGTYPQKSDSRSIAVIARDSGVSVSAAAVVKRYQSSHIASLWTPSEI